MFTPDQGIFMVIIAIVGYVAWREWLRHKRREFIHKERLAALEKGVELQPLDQEIKRSSWNVQRTLLLAGLVWVSIGVSVFVTLNAIISSPANKAADVPQGAQWIGIAPAAIGLSHLIVYVAGRKKERQ